MFKFIRLRRVKTVFFIACFIPVVAFRAQTQNAAITSNAESTKEILAQATRLCELVPAVDCSGPSLCTISMVAKCKGKTCTASSKTVTSDTEASGCPLNKEIQDLLKDIDPDTKIFIDLIYWERKGGKKTNITHTILVRN